MNVEQFQVRGFGDHLLVEQDGKIRQVWMLFFEADEEYRMFPGEYFYFDKFETPNGFHIVGSQVVYSMKEKIAWFEAWKREYPRSDYILSRCNVLTPHSDEEGRFILRVAQRAGAKEVPQVLYYRDKKVWETWPALK